MDAYESLLTRRSTKNFKPDAIPGEILDKILEQEHTPRADAVCSRP